VNGERSMHSMVSAGTGSKRQIQNTSNRKNKMPPTFRQIIETFPRGKNFTNHAWTKTIILNDRDKRSL
ncbi:hypothetical protein, partial [Paracoccus benzoatiresistens]